MSNKGFHDDALLRASLERRYEGPEVLEALLEKSGATYSTAEAKEELEGAAANGALPDEVFPILFHDTPRLSNEAEARRLYSNLFGLWDQVAGLTLDCSARDVAPAPPAPGEPLTTSWVEASWKNTSLLPPHEFSRQWDRFTQRQPDLLTFLAASCAHLPESAFDTAAMASFEAWRAYRGATETQAKDAPPQPLASLSRDRLDELLASPRQPDAEPALADLWDESLELAKAEEPGQWPEEVSEALRRVLGAVGAVMGEGWRP